MSRQTRDAAREAEAARRVGADFPDPPFVADLPVAVNPLDKQAPAETTLAADVAIDARSLQVVDATGFKPTTARQSYYARLGGTELVSVGEIVGDSVAVGRGMNGTRAIAHPAGATVVFGPPTFFGTAPTPPAAGDKVVGQVVTDYAHALPRDLHKAHGETKRVTTAEDCDAALADGWTLTPPVEAAYPTTLYAADGRACEVHSVGEAVHARTQGYVLAEKPPPSVA